MLMFPKLYILDIPTIHINSISYIHDDNIMKIIKTKLNLIEKKCDRYKFILQ